MPPPYPTKVVADNRNSPCSRRALHYDNRNAERQDVLDSRDCLGGARRYSLRCGPRVGATRL